VLLNYFKYDSVCLVGPSEKISTFSWVISGKYSHQFAGINSSPQRKNVCVEHDDNFLTAKQAANLKTQNNFWSFLYSLWFVYTLALVIQWLHLSRLGDTSLPLPSLTVKNLCSSTAKFVFSSATVAPMEMGEKAGTMQLDKRRNYWSVKFF